MLKHPSLRLGVSTKTDDRVHAMDDCKALPLSQLMLQLVPELYPVHILTDEGGILKEDIVIPQPPRLALNSGSIDRNGAFLLDTGTYLYLWVGSAISPTFCSQVFNRPDFSSLEDGLCDLPELENEMIKIDTSDCCREDSRNRHVFIQYMIEDKTESSMSYYEFLQHIQKQQKS
ncbi:SEC24B [Bugula neritina]|uniref:SEC24B n=1 Tax=Bugula neritina TaxID=10212 RepID=A0A7J7JWS8_BUGNE|nr:SEC24B [Bugula neritina]